MKTTINGPQIMLLIAKYGPTEFEHLKQFEGEKTSLSLMSNDDSQFYAVFETVEGDEDESAV